MIHGKKQLTFEDYDGFVRKFKPKNTTDDCYTPVAIYEAVKDFAVKEFHLEGREIVRPFYPGGDYEMFDYPENCVVIDNPPFSIESAIVKNLNKWKVDYFLFGPLMTLFGIRNTNYIIAGEQIKYENGAMVPTGFVTNLGDDMIRTCPELSSKIKEVNDIQKANLPIFVYPDNLLTINQLMKIDRAGIDYRVRKGLRVSKLDSQFAYDKAIFGGGTS